MFSYVVAVSNEPNLKEVAICFYNKLLTAIKEANPRESAYCRSGRKYGYREHQ